MITVPRHIRKAIRSWKAWRRRKQFMRELGVDDLTTKFDAARRRHKATKPHADALKAAVTAKLRQELHHG